LCLLFAGRTFAFDKQAAVNELYTKSGLEQQLGQFGPEVAAGFKGMKNLTDEERYKVYELVIGAYDSKNLTPVLKAYLVNNLSEKDITSTLTWLNSPLGSQITKIEIDASSQDPGKDLEKKAYIESLSTNPPSSQRIDLLNRLGDITNGAEFVYSVEIFMADMMMKAMPKDLTPEQKQAVQKARFRYDLMKDQIEGQIKQSQFTSGLYTYKDISDDQLSQYINFLSTPEGKEYTLTTESALKEAMKAPGQKIVDYIAAILEQKMKEKAEAAKAGLN